MSEWTWVAAIGLACAGALLGLAMLLGVWKYVEICRSPESRAPLYVDIAHRAALLYAFATTLLAMLAQHNALAEPWALACVLGAVASFVVSIASYVLHGALRDTDNQFHPPYRLGARPVHGSVIHGAMILKAVVDIAAVTALIAGFGRAQAWW